MMKRYLLSIIMGILAFANYSYGQVELNFAGQNGNANGTVDVDVTVNGFTNLAGLQFSAGWDSLVMTYNSIVFTNPDLSDLTVGNFGSPEGAGVDEGQFTFSYNNPTGDGNLDDGAVMFTVRFNLVGGECDETNAGVTDTPLQGSAFDVNFNEFTVTGTPGVVMINGADCGGGGGGGNELTISAEMATTGPGENVCVSLNSDNFIGVQAGSGTIVWNPAIIDYTGIDNINIGGVGGSLNDIDVDAGELKFVWSNPDPANPLTLANGTPIFDICFDAVGAVGDVSPVTLSTAGGLGFEWFDDNDDEIPQVLNNGSVTIIEDVGSVFTLIVSDSVAIPGEGQGCVDISVENWVNIISTQYVITWDPAIFGNATPTAFNLDGLNASSFNINNAAGSSTFTWNGAVGTDLPDGTVIYSLCFDLLGDCDDSSDIQIVDQGSTNIEIVDGNTDLITNFSIDQGSLTIICPPECDITSIDQPCPGTLSGNVIVDVPEDGCTYSWANSSGTEISTDKNLLGVGEGTYILTVTCDGAETCTLEATVTALPDLTITDDVTSAGCGDQGSITVTVTGGSGNYSYNWNPTQPNSPSITNLDPGSYGLTVTDTDSGCTETASYTITTTEADLEIQNEAVSDETCVGMNNGSITLAVVGGCMPYTYTWSDASIGNTPNAANLAPGTYMVTITDDATPTNTVEGSYTINATTEITMTGAAIITPSTGSDGAITINVTGGTSPYSYAWSIAVLPNSNMITGLAPGSYSVTVTDDNDCSVTFGPFVVGDNTTTTVLPMIDNVDAVNNDNGFAIACNGGATGVISGIVSGGNTPLTITLSGPSDSTLTLNMVGTFTFMNLEAGDYVVTVSNADGEDSETVSVTGPEEALVTNIDRGCDEEDQCDGFIDLNTSGGVGAYTYEWSDPDLDGDSVDDLCMGDYTVIISDENGCVRMESISILDCNPIPTGCYEVRNIITPNGDGLNDIFAVTCINDFPASLEVYSRWGELVYNEAVYDGTWSGISNSSEELIEGGYMYVMVIDFGQGNRQVMKGTVTILRD